MEMNQRLQELRKQKGLTQEELAEALFVSRAAISKWESGRGYPNIDSLKAISKFFNITVDELLSGEELLAISEEQTRKTESHFRDIVFGLLDLSAALLIFLPFFGQKADHAIHSVSLLSLTTVTPLLHTGYYISVIGIVIVGVLTLALQSWENAFWVGKKSKISLLLTAVGVLVFVISQQPYAATFLLVLLIVKASMLIKWQ